MLYLVLFNTYSINIYSTWKSLGVILFYVILLCVGSFSSADRHEQTKNYKTTLLLVRIHSAVCVHSVVRSWMTSLAMMHPEVRCRAALNHSLIALINFTMTLLFLHFD